MDEEGWQFPRRRRRKYKGKEITFFITRFPFGMSTANIWKVLEDFGKVNNIFIPKKKARGGYVFAFVRFVGYDSKVGEVVLGQLMKGLPEVKPSCCATSTVSTENSFKQVLVDGHKEGFRVVEMEAFTTKASVEWGSNALVGTHRSKDGSNKWKGNGVVVVNRSMSDGSLVGEVNQVEVKDVEGDRRRVNHGRAKPHKKALSLKLKDTLWLPKVKRWQLQNWILE
ncbi:hypothetical protein QVD17_08218 [Tagetes erecta]|uniref:RRM domain-containing protein n=1 Tax=Tagetes erecta TaxID=13708 RepID=A0AAD8L273_TARER|nr:hypothetical protein QVD17_08218 [Tagetes erecta]